MQILPKMPNYTKEVAEIKGLTKISCIIPAYNEEQRIQRVIKAVKDYPHFDEIIVIDDGSEDKTKEKVLETNTKLIVHNKNKGKTAAVLTGINKSQGELTVLIDADLIGLTHSNISRLILPILSKEYDMTILDRQGDREAVWGWTNCARFVGGERAFWKNEFNKITISADSGYLLEIILNLHYMEEKKKIKTIYCKNLKTVHQYQKIGRVKGYYSYLKMAKKIVEKSTIQGYLNQIKYIEDEHKTAKKENLMKNRKIKINKLKKAVKKQIGRKKYKEIKQNIESRIKKAKLKERIKKWNSKRKELVKILKKKRKSIKFSKKSTKHI